MRVFVLSLVGILFSHLIVAQGFQPGFCVFGNDGRTQHTGKLRIHSDYLDFKNEKGEVSRLLPEDVYRCQIGNSKFMTASGFIAPTLTAEKVIKLTFVQLLDSGQVMLMCYDPELGSASYMGVGGANNYMRMYGGSGTSAYITYLLQRPSEDDAVSLPKNNKELRQSLASYIGSREDLAKLLTDKRISQRNLQAFIHALNTGQPFVDVPRNGLASEF